MTDKLMAQNDRAQHRVDRWSRLEIIVIALTVVVAVAAVVFVFFIVPIRNTVNEDHCVIHATAVAAARYQHAVAEIQTIPIGPDRAKATAEINASVKALRDAVEHC